MTPISPLMTAPQMLGSNALGTAPVMGSGFSIAGMQNALSLKAPIAGSAVGETFQLSSQLDPTTAAKTITTSSTASTASTKTVNSGRTDAEIQKVSKDFEAIFLRMLFKEMRNTVEKSGLMGGNSRAMEFFESMYDEQIADQMSKAGGVGFSQVVYQQLKSTTEAHQRTIS